MKQQNPDTISERVNSMTTQGKKGAKMPRLNLALTYENHDLIKLLAKATGQSLAKVVNAILTTYREQNADIVKQAQAVANSLQGAALDLYTQGSADEGQNNG